MPPTFKQMTDYFKAVGADAVGHTQKTYLAHAIGVYNDMKKWGGDEELCRAAMFHSIYGTELFQKFALPLDRRDELRQFIGTRAEKLAYVNCAMDRASFDRAVQQTSAPYSIRDRISGETIDLTQAELDDLMRIHLCDWLEQAPRSERREYRRDAYRNIAERLGGNALELYNQEFACTTA
jgi:hypothetical protein